MAAYLKYCFILKGEEVFFDSVACVHGREPELPNGFFKWYEDGDFENTPIPPEMLENLDSPIFEAIYRPRKMSASLIQKIADYKSRKLE